MTDVTMLVWVGTLVGVILGAAHAVYVYRVVARGATGVSNSQVRGVYYASWTVLLWLLLGSYVVALWLAGAATYVLFRSFR